MPVAFLQEARSPTILLCVWELLLRPGRCMERSISHKHSIPIQ